MSRYWEDRLGRAIDMLVALAILVFVAPMMLAIGLLIRRSDPGPVFFGHERVGRDRRRFRCWKFRSMATDAEQRLQDLLARDAQARAEWDRDHKLRDDPRITRLGAFLRKSSLDELPQLFNIIRGEMSLVGPRPIVEAEIPRYGRYFRHYCTVRPGLTGLWQVSGRSDVSYEQRVAMDVTYVRSKCLVLDLQILLKTIPAVLVRKGSY